jgi:uncharacterized protein with HEPN domain
MRRESAYVRDALRAIEELEEFVGRTSRERFLADRLEQSFVFHRLVILGEAAAALAKVFQEKYPEVPWPRLISLRNRLVHAYFDLDMPLVWGIASSHLDELRRQLQRILDAEFPDEIESEPAP